MELDKIDSNLVGALIEVTLSHADGGLIVPSSGRDGNWSHLPPPPTTSTTTTAVSSFDLSLPLTAAAEGRSDGADGALPARAVTFPPPPPTLPRCERSAHSPGT